MALRYRHVTMTKLHVMDKVRARKGMMSRGAVSALEEKYII